MKGAIERRALGLGTVRYLPHSEPDPEAIRLMEVLRGEIVKATGLTPEMIGKLPRSTAPEAKTVAKLKLSELMHKIDPDLAAQVDKLLEES